MSPSDPVPVVFTPVARENLGDYPTIRDQAQTRVRELGVPGAAEQLGHPCRDDLKGCRTIKVGAHHRLIYTVRETDIVVIAIGKRRREQAYDLAARVLQAGLPAPTTTNPAPPAKGAVPPAPPRRRPKKKGRRSR